MLLARFGASHICFLAKRGTRPVDLPEAGVLLKTDLVRGAQTGFATGGIAGMLGGVFPRFGSPFAIWLSPWTILITSLLGALFGMWVSSMIGAQLPNSRLTP